VFENDEDYATRTRCFAAFAVGLLGDQPTGSGDYAVDEQGAQHATTARLWDLLQQKYADDDLYAALFLALGLQPKSTIGNEIRDGLVEIMLKGRLGKLEFSDLTRSFAALTLGRVGDATALEPLTFALTARTVDLPTQRSAAIALGLLGRRVDAAGRLQLAKALKDGIERNRDASVRNFGLISLAYLVVADIEDAKTDVLDGAKVGEYLLAQAEDGGYVFAYLRDESQAVAKAYRAACTPDLFLFDRSRRLVYRGQFDSSRPRNNVPVTGADLRAACDAVLAGETPSADQRSSIGCNIKWKPGNEPDYWAGRRVGR